jgi:hypothetical protein
LLCNINPAVFSQVTKHNLSHHTDHRRAKSITLWINYK